MKNKINLGILFGGNSFEHEVSLLSTKNVLEALDRNKYEIHLIGITKEGEWYLYKEGSHLLHEDDPQKICLGQKGEMVNPFSLDIDVVFPLLHGPNGEDGTVQGLLHSLGIPYVGAGVLGSAIGMDKDVAKRLMRDGGLPHAPFLSFCQHEQSKWSLEHIQEHISFPLFVKPANSGSSIGITKVTEPKNLSEALAIAFVYDRKIILEEAIVGSEVQFAVMGNTNIQISKPCEIVPKGDLHCYAAKYLDPRLSQFRIPANLTRSQEEEGKELALRTYRLLECEGFARVDLFLNHLGEFVVSEINTIPGMTKQSPFAKMWESSGVPYSSLLDRIIGYALERKKRAGQMKTRYEGACQHV